MKISAAAAADNLPDIFMVRREVWLRLVDQGMVAAVDDLYAKMPTRLKSSTMPTAVLFQRSTVSPMVLASPGSIAIRTRGVLIRKDWLDKLGLCPDDRGFP